MNQLYIDDLRRIFNQYKKLGEGAMVQVQDEQRLFWTFYNGSNSIGVLVQHLSGDMLSRFTSFYEDDGEKPWRNRDMEFESVLSTRSEVMHHWEKGWRCFIDVLDGLRPQDLEKIVLTGGEEHTVMEALNRQLAHYSYHIGQIVFLSKMLAIDHWDSLSIPQKGRG
jgi:hypothetical protein